MEGDGYETGRTASGPGGRRTFGPAGTGLRRGCRRGRPAAGGPDPGIRRGLSRRRGGRPPVFRPRTDGAGRQPHRPPVGPLPGGQRKSGHYRLRCAQRDQPGAHPVPESQDGGGLPGRSVHPARRVGQLRVHGAGGGRAPAGDGLHRGRIQRLHHHPGAAQQRTEFLCRL